MDCSSFKDSEQTFLRLLYSLCQQFLSVTLYTIQILAGTAIMATFYLVLFKRHRHTHTDTYIDIPIAFGFFIHPSIIYNALDI